MTQAYIDTIEDIGMTEENGIITSVERRILVGGLTGATWETMSKALRDAKVPENDDRLGPGSFDDLKVVGRTVAMLSKQMAEVIVSYSIKSAGQDLSDTTGSIISGKMTASVAQKKTNLYKPEGRGEDQFITLEHTYDEEDPDYGGKVVSQTGEIDVMIPQRSYTIDGFKNTTRPWNLAKNMVGCINSSTYLGQGIHTWMCTECSWEYVERGRFLMGFTFQHNPDTWNPVAMFIDDRTDKPPLNLVLGKGLQMIKYHKAVNFTDQLGFEPRGPR